jgi:ABC-type amino acid transport substrate-binding protein
MKQNILKILLFFTLAINIFPKVITITCTDQDWYPFIFSEDSEYSGMHLDIVKDALTNLGYSYEIYPYPLRRAIVLVNEGRYDAVMAIPYSDYYENLEFPKGAESKNESEYRIMQVDQVLITLKSLDYKYNGNRDYIPNPIRLLFGMEELALKLDNGKMRFEFVKSDNQNFKKLIRDKHGSIIATTIVAENMMENEEFKQQIKIHSKPITSQSYYLAFAKNSKNLSEAEKQKIWNEIKRLREDYIYMMQIYAKY